MVNRWSQAFSEKKEVEATTYVEELRVTVEGYYSEYNEVRLGVPQGSVLGPLFFIVAVNKLSDHVKCELFQYADDMVAHHVIARPKDCQAFQKCLNQLGSYHITSQNIPTESQSTCLGMVIDRKLNQTAQVDAVSAKCRKRLHAIRTYFPPRLGAARQLLYKSLVLPVAEHACSVWNPTNQ
ncbi:hypothetical protein RvY_16509 [Ramazzottius varieornatus]|uniref:Reverse transcriptase domain-containing protein n=1 Tax=Ramazzottius varieornatus TaxID=947166 RepID=A0A1D1VZJ5_RAMVA|nr:hypothetical protein RvY_16509 [Ramazzottius varieornatus]